MGNTIKFVSGIVLLVIGILMAYEATIYNLIDMVLIVGFFIAIVGFILIISYVIDYNAEKTSGLIKDFFNSADINAPSLNFSKRNTRYHNNFDNNGPLIMRDEHDDYDYGKNIDDTGLWEYYESDQYQPNVERNVFSESDTDESKEVLNVVNENEEDVDLDNELQFTPYYEKPVKVTRKPKKRSGNQIYVEVPDKSDEIKRALTQDVQPEVISTVNAEEPAQGNIEIDVNHPEKLPVPKSLKGNILFDNSLLTSGDAFEQLAANVHKEIMLEIPSLNSLSDRFLSHVPTIYSRVIIDEFDLSDISYTVLIASLLKQGVHIKTVPKVHTVNLITDDSHAMIISDSQTSDDSEYGAIYEDRNSISSIRSDFERTWKIASNLDEKLILNNIAGGVA